MMHDVRTRIHQRQTIAGFLVAAVTDVFLVLMH